MKLEEKRKTFFAVLVAWRDEKMTWKRMISCKDVKGAKEEIS